MAAPNNLTGSIYVNVIEEVIGKVREEFVKDGGPGESVLQELQGMWELKLSSANIILPTDRSSAQRQAAVAAGLPVRDLNVPYEGTAEELDTPTPGLTPTAEMLFGSMQTPTPLPGTVDSSSYNIPTGLSDYPTPLNDGGSNAEAKGGRPSPYMQTPSPWSNQRTPLSVDVNVAYVEGRDEVDRGTSHQPLTQDFFTMSAGKRKREDFAAQYHNGGYIPQQDGAGDAMTEISNVEASRRSKVLGEVDSVTSGNGEKIPCPTRSTKKIPQVDGPIPDPYEDMMSPPNVYTYQGVVNEDYNITTPAPDIQAATPAPVIQNDAPDDDDDDDEPLNENDDDDDLDDVDDGEEQNTQHLVLAQFDKVSRTKSRWKCTLKDGIVHINNRDILFNKATGEFDF